MNTTPYPLNILLIDQDPDMLDALASLADGLGHFATESAHPDRAVTLLKSVAFDVLITGPAIGRVSGPAFIAQALVVRPALGAVMVATTPRARDLAATSAVPLAQPLTMSGMRRAIDEALRRRGMRGQDKQGSDCPEAI